MVHLHSSVPPQDPTALEAVVHLVAVAVVAVEAVAVVVAAVVSCLPQGPLCL